MPIDTAPSGVATDALKAIPYGSLIGGPLDACIKAQATSAMTTVDFIQKVGFTKDDQVRNVTFGYMVDGEPFNLVVPLLAIVPIPYIGIDQITIDFKANIRAESSSVTEDSSSTSFAGEASGGAKVGFGPFSVNVNFKANYSSKKDSKATQSSKYSVEYTMDIHVAASQSDMPAGLAKVLNILESNITRMSAKGKVDVLPSRLTLEAGKATPIELRVLDGTGNPVKDATIAFEGAAPAKVSVVFPSGAADDGVYVVKVTADKDMTVDQLAFKVDSPTAKTVKRTVTIPVTLVAPPKALTAGTTP
jgi:hypothetical protein